VKLIHCFRSASRTTLLSALFLWVVGSRIRAHIAHGTQSGPAAALEPKGNRDLDTAFRRENPTSEGDASKLDTQATTLSR